MRWFRLSVASRGASPASCRACRLAFVAALCWCWPALLCSAADTGQESVAVPLAQWLRLQAIFATLDSTSPALVTDSRKLETESEQQQQELTRQSTLATQYKTELTELRPELLSLRTLLPQVRSELAASETSLAASQTELSSAQSSLARADESLKVSRDESARAFWTGIAIGAGVGLGIAGAVYLVLLVAGA